MALALLTYKIVDKYAERTLAENLLWNVPFFAFNKAAHICLALLPVTFMLARVLPKDSAAKFGFISAILYASTDWISELSGAGLCYILKMTSENLIETYKLAIVA